MEKTIVDDSIGYLVQCNPNAHAKFIGLDPPDDTIVMCLERYGNILPSKQEFEKRILV